jgi:hypothetical protein
VIIFNVIRLKYKRVDFFPTLFSIDAHRRGEGEGLWFEKFGHKNAIKHENR